MFSYAKPLPGMSLHADRPTLRKAMAAAVIIMLLTLGVTGGVSAGTRAAAHYTGRVLYRSNKAPVAGVLVEAVEAEAPAPTTANRRMKSWGAPAPTPRDASRLP